MIKCQHLRKVYEPSDCGVDGKCHGICTECGAEFNHLSNWDYRQFHFTTDFHPPIKKESNRVMPPFQARVSGVRT